MSLPHKMKSKAAKDYGSILGRYMSGKSVRLSGEACTVRHLKMVTKTERVC